MSMTESEVKCRLKYNKKKCEEKLSYNVTRDRNEIIQVLVQKGYRLKKP